MNHHHLPIITLTALCLRQAAAAQSTISPTDKSAYAANSGWIDFRTSAANGVVATETCLAGKAYAANFGWIDLGDGSPVNGHTYSNASTTDFGVNLAASGALTGYAYAANVGWINFEQTYGQPRLNFLTGSARAFRRGRGWIPPSRHAVAACPDSRGASEACSSSCSGSPRRHSGRWVRR